MGTRGSFGFRIDGTDKTMYNHFDSYPSCLGLNVLQTLRERLSRGEGALLAQMRAVRVITGDTEPTPEDIAALAPYTDLSVSEQSTSDWYCLTRQLQGDTGAVLDAGVMRGDRGFMNDSLFCEWAYIINGDDRTLEAYRGFQSRKHSKGRYAIQGRPADWTPSYKGQKFYYPVALVHAWSFDALPTDAEFATFWRRRKAWF